MIPKLPSAPSVLSAHQVLLASLLARFRLNLNMCSCGQLHRISRHTDTLLGPLVRLLYSGGPCLVINRVIPSSDFPFFFTSSPNPWTKIPTSTPRAYSGKKMEKLIFPCNLKGLSLQTLSPPGKISPHVAPSLRAAGKPSLAPDQTSTSPI